MPFTTVLSITVVISVIASISSAVTFSSSLVGLYGGGGLLPIALSIQRFNAVSVGIGVPIDNSQRLLAESLEWANGEIEFISPPPTMLIPRQRESTDMGSKPLRLRQLASAGNTTQHDLPTEMVDLLNILLTALLAVALTLVVQAVLVQLWRRCVNRKYYRRGGKFRPWPKSLVWPTPLFFSCCIFITGLTRASVALLVSAPDPEVCGLSCQILPIVVICFLIGFVVLSVMVMIAFHKHHGAEIVWKPSGRPGHPSEVTDPYMRLRAKLRVLALGVQLLAKDRANGLRRASRSHWSSLRESSERQKSLRLWRRALGFRGVVSDVVEHASGYRSRVAPTDSGQTPDPPPSPPSSDSPLRPSSAGVRLTSSSSSLRPSSAPISPDRRLARASSSAVVQTPQKRCAWCEDSSSGLALANEAESSEMVGTPPSHPSTKYEPDDTKDVQPAGANQDQSSAMLTPKPAAMADTRPQLIKSTEGCCEGVVAAPSSVGNVLLSPRSSALLEALGPEPMPNAISPRCATRRSCLIEALLHSSCVGSPADSIPAATPPLIQQRLSLTPSRSASSFNVNLETSSSPNRSARHGWRRSGRPICRHEPNQR